MNTPADHMWSQAQDNMDPMATMNGNLDDLSNIFNIDEFDLDSLPNMDATGFGDQMPQSHPGTHPSTPFDENMGQLGAPPGTAAQDFGAHTGFDMQGSMNDQQHFGNQTMATMPFGADSMYQPSMPQQYPPQQQQNFHFQQQQPFPSNQVPPTPDSLELHGEAGRFMQQQMDAQQRAMYEQQYQMRKEQLQFTPMASPSTTPYHMNTEFPVSGDFFSPLTSPALHAQNTSQMHQQFMSQPQGYYTNPSTAASSAAPSPIDPNKDVEMTGDGAANSESATQSKKTSRRKPATPRTFALNKVKQSPIQKAQKRKSAALSNVDADAAMQDVQKSGHIAPKSAGFQMPPFLESSENDSVSPEALSDIPMGPPPRPGSAYQSPALRAQKGELTGPAATPKSLLSMRSAYDANPASSGISGQMGQASLEDLELPEAADGREAEQSKTTIVQSTSSQEHTPRLTASRKTPKLGPLSTPSSGRPLSISGSPAMSPMTASTPAGILKDKKDNRSSRGTSKKRGSVCTTSSTLASPALRPKVSPSIKPLLPEGTNLHSPTHALLLASKSNYQNLLEGNHLPGISYPDSLSTGLTSKRTSHKVAEQGRRNRINDALKEMQALIPASSGARAEELMTGAGDDDSQEAKEKDRDAAVKSNSSKAATVESANRYIRVLKDSDAVQKATIAELQKAIDEMRVRLGETTEPAMDKGGEAPATPVQVSTSPKAATPTDSGAEKTEKADVASPQEMDESKDVVPDAVAVDAVK